jgi:hypothetical protein
MKYAIKGSWRAPETFIRGVRRRKSIQTDVVVAGRLCNTLPCSFLGKSSCLRHPETSTAFGRGTGDSCR